MAKDVAKLILRHRPTEPGAEPDKGDRRFLAIEPFERKILHHDDAAAVHQLAPHVVKHLAERLEWKTLPLDINDGYFRAPHRLDPIGELVGIAIAHPIAPAR